MSLTVLPHVNASLNALSTVFLMLGFVFIRRGNRRSHRSCMFAAMTSSVLFLICYLIYHFNVPRTDFVNPAWFRPYYLVILSTHILLAVVIVPLAIITFVRALRERFDRHKQIARWTWPLWMYVSVTGVLIYFLLYHLFPQK